MDTHRCPGHLPVGGTVGAADSSDEPDGARLGSPPDDDKVGVDVPASIGEVAVELWTDAGDGTCAALLVAVVGAPGVEHPTTPTISRPDNALKGASRNPELRGR
jgi:hypothetical protein